MFLLLLLKTRGGEARSRLGGPHEPRPSDAPHEALKSFAHTFVIDHNVSCTNQYIDLS